MTKQLKRSIRIDGDVAYVPLTKGYEAVIDAARAEGVREGMLKAAEIAGGMLINSYRADGVVEYRDFVAVAIRAAAEAQP